VKHSPTVSIVLPVYNEKESLLCLYEKIRESCNQLGRPFEIVFVDDGSSDKTFEILEGIHGRDCRVKVIRFGKNFGQTAAMTAGFEFANGEIIVSVDGYLQNDPADIPALLAKREEGYALVRGWRKDRRRVTSRLWHLAQ